MVDSKNKRRQGVYTFCLHFLTRANLVYGYFGGRMGPIFIVRTLKDAATRAPRTHDEEAEYRRGYKEGFAAAMNAYADAQFLGKERCAETVFSFWYRSIQRWAAFMTEGIMPPRFVVRCVYCGEPASQKDHVIPRSRGGGNTQDNLVPACARCNQAKGDRTPEEWLGI